MTLILNNEQIETLFDMPACLAAMDEAYQELGAGRAANIPRADLLAPTDTEGRYHAFKTMSGTIPHMKLTALRINSDVLHWPRSEKGSHLRVKIPAGRGRRWGGSSSCSTSKRASSSRSCQTALFKRCGWAQRAA